MGMGTKDPLLVVGVFFLPRTRIALMMLLPTLVGGCHKLMPDGVAVSTVTLTGTAIAPVDQVGKVMPSSLSVLRAIRTGSLDMPLANARVQVLDANLQPIPGVNEVHTDGSGRYALDVPAGRAVVIRFLYGVEDKQMNLMTMARPDKGQGSQVVNADLASHVATKMVLGRASGVEAGLAAVGASDLKFLVEAIRTAIGDQNLRTSTAEAVEEVAQQQSKQAAFSGVLDRVDRAAASRVGPGTTAPEMVLASTSLAAAPAPSPSPSPSPTPGEAPQQAPIAALVPEALPVVAPPEVTRVAPKATVLKRRAQAVVDPFEAAREWATVHIIVPNSGTAPHAADAQQFVRPTTHSRLVATHAIKTCAAPSAKPAQHAAPTGQPAFKPIPASLSANARDSAQAKPVAARKASPWRRLLQMLVHWLPTIAAPRS